MFASFRCLFRKRERESSISRLFTKLLQQANLVSFSFRAPPLPTNCWPILTDTGSPECVPTIRGGFPAESRAFLASILILKLTPSNTLYSQLHRELYPLGIGQTIHFE